MEPEVAFGILDVMTEVFIEPKQRSFAPGKRQSAVLAEEEEKRKLGPKEKNNRPVEQKNHKSGGARVSTGNHLFGPDIQREEIAAGSFATEAEPAKEDKAKVQLGKNMLFRAVPSANEPFGKLGCTLREAEEDEDSSGARYCSADQGQTLVFWAALSRLEDGSNGAKGTGEKKEVVLKIHAPREIDGCETLAIPRELFHSLHLSLGQKVKLAPKSLAQLETISRRGPRKRRPVINCHLHENRVSRHFYFASSNALPIKAKKSECETCVYVP